MAGEDAPSLLTRSVRRDTGEAMWLLTKATLYTDPSGGRLAINIIEDVTEAKEAELRQRFLAEAGQLLATSLDYEQTLERVARMIVPGLADWCGIEMVDEHGESHQVAVAHVDPEKVQMAHDLRRRYPTDPDAPTGVPAILRGGPAELYSEIPRRADRAGCARRGAPGADPRAGHALGDGRADADRRRDARRDHAGVCRERPALRRGRPRVRRGPGAARRHRRPELAPVRGAGARGAYAPGQPAARAAARRCRAGRSGAAYQAGERDADVGGDFYDILPVEGGHLVVLGDVTGKGVEAAALTSLVRYSARMAARFDPRPARVLALVNEVLREQPRLSLVTAVCALVATDGDRATVTVASAGHPLPLLRRPGEPPAALGEHGVLLGVEGEDDWRETVVEIAPGETLLFYTDGVTETPGEDDRFGDSRLRDAVARAGEAPEELLAEIDRSLREFQSGVTLDDRAMLALRFVGDRRARGSTGGAAFSALQ